MGSTPLHLAVESRNVSLVEALLKAKGIDVNAKNSFNLTPIHCAEAHPDPEMVALLRSKEKKGFFSIMGNMLARMSSTSSREC